MVIFHALGIRTEKHVEGNGAPMKTETFCGGSSSALVLSENEITYADSRNIFENQQRNLLCECS